MPTRHPRIAVIRDPELDDALRRVGPQLCHMSDAGRLRALALLGARSINEQLSGIERAATRLDELGATPARGDLLAISRRLRDRACQTSETGSESLEWVRGPR